MKIEIKVLNENCGLPQYQTSGSAAIDLVCTEDVTIFSGECKMIPTGVAIWIGSNSDGYNISKMQETGDEIESYYNFPENIGIAGIILPRSGLGSKGLILGNTIGLIDADYQGELMVSAWNRNGISTGDQETFKLNKGDRFAQLMFIPVIKAQWEVVKEFSNMTDRGQGGFGSTDKVVCDNCNQSWIQEACPKCEGRGWI